MTKTLLLVLSTISLNGLCDLMEKIDGLLMLRHLDIYHINRETLIFFYGAADFVST